MKPKYLKEWLSLPEAIELVGGDAMGLELAVQDGKITPQISGAGGVPVYLVDARTRPTARLDPTRDLVLIKDTYAPWAKDIEYPAPKFSRSEIASVFGFHPTPPPDSAAQPAPKKRLLNAGGRPPKTNWHPIDMYIVAIVFDNSFPESQEAVSEITNRVVEYVDDTFKGEVPGREEIQGRVIKILDDFHQAVSHARGETYS
jgi:hypothetical protein